MDNVISLSDPPGTHIRHTTRSRSSGHGERYAVMRCPSGVPRDSSTPQTRNCRSTPKTRGRLAQSVEHLPYKQGVGGSSPPAPTSNVQVRACFGYCAFAF
jgi:hypothetical protein